MPRAPGAIGTVGEGASWRTRGQHAEDGGTGGGELDIMESLDSWKLTASPMLLYERSICFLQSLLTIDSTV